MLFDLKGKVAVVTGGSRGIGRAIAENLAAHGAAVTVTSRKEDACRTVADAITARGGKALAIASSISDKASLERMVKSTREAFGPVDILVANAASNPYYGPLLDIPDETFEKIMRNNVLSTIWLCKLTVPDMAARGGGSVIIVSSIGGFKGSTVIGAYGISKAADMQLARDLACEWGPKNVRINCIAPGLVKTDFARALWENPEVAARVMERVPSRRIGEPDDIAGLAVLLASRAGAFMNGTTLTADGGATIGG